MTRACNAHRYYINKAMDAYIHGFFILRYCLRFAGRNGLPG